MAFIGKTPTPVPLTANDITDGIISTDKLADTSVTNAKINADLISAETELATAPADTDELLISDAGVLKRIDASLIGGGGIEMADQWRLTASITSNTDPISSNLEQVDTSGQGTLGTGMTVSSGRFSFPQTGIYLVRFIANGVAVPDDNVSVGIKLTVNNSSYNTLVEPQDSGDGSSTGSFNVSGETLVDVTDISNVKVSFFTSSLTAGSSVLGDTNVNYTAFTFIRLGDT